MLNNHDRLTPLLTRLALHTKTLSYRKDGSACSNLGGGAGGGNYSLTRKLDMQSPWEVQAQTQEHTLQLRPVTTGDTDFNSTKIRSSIHSWLATVNTPGSLQLPRVAQRGVDYSHKSISGKKCRRPLEEVNTNMASSVKRQRGRSGKASSSVCVTR